ncbi:TPA: hypothetical protein ACJIWO_000184 [Enterobacter cloacae]
MSTITKEQLIRRAHMTVSRGARELEKHPDRDCVAADIKIASIAARSLMAEPIYQLWDEGYYDTEKETYDAALKAGGRGRIVYTAPPAPVSVPAAYEHTEDFSEYHEGWNACRAAMLQGAEPVTTAYKLPEPIKDNRLNSGPEADDYYSGYQAGWNELLEAVSGNSSVTPDGWVSVIDQTPDEYDFDIWVFSPSIGVHDGVQWDGLEFADDEYQFRIKDVSHWMKKIYPAAPQKEA